MPADGSQSSLTVLISVLLVLGSIFFVAAEYAIVSARRSRLEALGKKGNKKAKNLAKELEDVSILVAASQIGITMVGIAIGTLTEPEVAHSVQSMLPGLPKSVSFAIGFLVVLFVLVVIGELCPKYFALRNPEATAMWLHAPLKWLARLFYPIIWLAQTTAGLILRLFKINLKESPNGGVPKEELLILVQSGGAEGTLDKMHAEMVTRALKLDVLMARDIMIHRLDVKWLDIHLTRDELLSKLKTVPFTRLPVCRADIDDVAGVVYLHDIVKNMDRSDFTLTKILRPAVAIPENLTMEKIVATMRDQKTQILMVMDEYGGTSGLITLEDVVEEVFGELEDSLESERPPIETFPNGRVSARADVRMDELLAKLGIQIDGEESTDTLAQVMVDSLERIPRPGDSVDSAIGLLRVENMARRRITRVSVQLRPGILESNDA